MVLKRLTGDFCSSYRPQTFSEVVGQTSIVKSLRQALLSKNHSHCYLFAGESGCGKTTMARIIGMSLNCYDRAENGDPCCSCESCISIATKTNIDFNEINASSKNGINDIRQIEQEMKTQPLFGKVKVYVLDEAHRLTTEAQNALLKDTEDMPSGVYIILCSTEPKKIIPTLRNRCETYNFKLLYSKEIRKLVETVGVFENFYPTEKELDMLVEASGNRPRNALHLLQQVINLRASNSTDDEIISLIQAYSIEDVAIINLCRMLTSNKNIPWNAVVSVYKNIESEPESIRIVLSSWFKAILEKAKTIEEANKTALCLELFTDMLPAIKPENKLVLNLFRVYGILNKPWIATK